MSGSYIVYKDGVELARTDSLIWVRLAEPGIYLTCAEEEGEVKCTPCQGHFSKTVQQEGGIPLRVVIN